MRQMRHLFYGGGTATILQISIQQLLICFQNATKFRKLDIPNAI